MRIGSVFAGVGGLDLAALDVWAGAEMAWHCEVDPAASRVLAHHWPGVPNLGDVEWIGLDFTADELSLIAEAMTVARDNPAQILPLRPLESDWSGVDPVDILTAGFPCQDVSAAGRRAGLRRGTRTGLWHQVTRAIAALRPRIVLLENVTGLLSADGDAWPESLKVLHAESNRWARVESLINNKIVKASKKGRFSGEWEHRKRQERIRASRLRIRVLAEFRRERSRLVQRAIATVLGDLAALGFDAEWTCLPASAVGACHKRDRIFILAFPADSQGGGWVASDADGAGSQGAQSARRHDLSTGCDREPVALLPTPTARLGDNRGASHPDRRRELNAKRAGELDEVAIHLLQPTPRASDGTKGGPNQRGSSGDLMLPSAAARLLPTPRASDTNGAGEHGDGGLDLRTAVIQWGDYAAAIARHEAAAGRPAPSPTELSARGNQRLSPAFAEWMMLWPAGWVTDPEIGLFRTEQLRCIGNGVVPPQASAAVRHLLSRVPRPAESLGVS